MEIEVYEGDPVEVAREAPYLRSFVLMSNERRPQGCNSWTFIGAQYANGGVVAWIEFTLMRDPEEHE